jgi:nucleolar complex protein 3
MCLDTIIHIFHSDLTGEFSLEIVRLLNRMIKEKLFQIQPKVLSCLVHLRLKTELKTRTSDTKMDKAVTKPHSKGKAAARRAKGKPTDQPHASKKSRKAMNEQKEIDRELREAEAEVDKEERDIRVRNELLRESHRS